MKKIAYIYSNLPAYRKGFFAGLDNSLSAEGVEMSVLFGTLTDKKEVKQDTTSGYKKVPFTSKTMRLGPITFVTIPGLFETFKKEKPDAAVISYMSTNLTMMRIVLYCLQHKKPYATWRCGYNNDDYKKIIAKIRSWLITFVEKKAKYCISYGSYYRQILINKGILPERIIVAQNTIDIESIVERNKDLVRDYSGEETKVLFVGALIKKKFLETSIEAVERLYKEDYKISFDIVGGGEMVEPLIKLVKARGLESIIHIVGPKYGDEVRTYFRDHDVFLAAGLGGLAINEAMAYGLPIISTNADWTICDLIDGNGYFMDKYKDVELQVKYLRSFMELSPEEKTAMSKRSIEIILGKASLSNMVAKHKEVCMKMIEQ